jgi:hypothetical protein
MLRGNHGTYLTVDKDRRAESIDNIRGERVEKFARPILSPDKPKLY